MKSTEYTPRPKELTLSQTTLVYHNTREEPDIHSLYIKVQQGKFGRYMETTYTEEDLDKLIEFLQEIRSK